jgi:mono/diheme cytochrome c family protein
MRLVTQGSFNVMNPTMGIMPSAFMGAFLITTTSQAQDPRVQRGRTFAQTHCASCHAIGMGKMGAAAKPDLNDVKYDAFLANDRTLADPEVIKVEPADACCCASSMAPR